MHQHRDVGHSAQVVGGGRGDGELGGAGLGVELVGGDGEVGELRDLCVLHRGVVGHQGRAPEPLGELVVASAVADVVVRVHHQLPRARPAPLRHDRGPLVHTAVLVARDTLQPDVGPLRALRVVDPAHCPGDAGLVVGERDGDLHLLVRRRGINTGGCELHGGHLRTLRVAGERVVDHLRGLGAELRVEHPGRAPVGVADAVPDVHGRVPHAGDAAPGQRDGPGPVAPRFVARDAVDLRAHLLLAEVRPECDREVEQAGLELLHRQGHADRLVGGGGVHVRQGELEGGERRRSDVLRERRRRHEQQGRQADDDERQRACWRCEVRACETPCSAGRPLRPAP